jgi:hypothetical protein
MHMPRPIIAIARWLAVENGFAGLSPMERRAAWFAALLTHLLLLPFSYGFVALSPKLRPGVYSYVLTQFMLALLFAKVAEVSSGL